MRMFASHVLAIAIITLTVGHTNLALASSKAISNSLVELEKSNEKLVRSFYQSLGQKDMKLVEKHLSDDFSFQNAMNGKRQFGKTVFSRWWNSMVHDAIKLEPKVERINVMGNTVLFETSFFYQDKNEQLTFRGTSFVKVKDGKITEYQEYKYPKIH